MKDIDQMSDDEFLNVLSDLENGKLDNTETLSTVHDNSSNYNNDDNYHEQDNETEETSNVEVEDELEDYDDESENEDETSVEHVDNNEAEDYEEYSENDDNEDTSSDDKEEQEDIDYKKEYEKLLEENSKYKDFYNKVTGEFIANGRKVRGFKDPEKIIQAQQMAAGFSEKMAKIKPYKPYLQALKDLNVLENPEKFNIAMSIINGDREAIKKVIKDYNIDPLDIDLEKINYEPKDYRANELQISYDDLIESAKVIDIDDKLEKVINTDWDDQSLVELLNDQQNKNDLLTHINTGIYDLVKNRIIEKRMTDFDQNYSNKPFIQQYREAAMELEDEFRRLNENSDSIDNDYDYEYDDYNKNVVNVNRNTSNINNRSSITNRRKVRKKKSNPEIAQKRRSVASMSNRRSGVTRTSEFNPLELDDKQFEDFFNQLLIN